MLRLIRVDTLRRVHTIEFLAERLTCLFVVWTVFFDAFSSMLVTLWRFLFNFQVLPVLFILTHMNRSLHYLISGNTERHAWWRAIINPIADMQRSASFHSLTRLPIHWYRRPMMQKMTFKNSEAEGEFLLLPHFFHLYSIYHIFCFNIFAKLSSKLSAAEASERDCMCERV